MDIAKKEHGSFHPRSMLKKKQFTLTVLGTRVACFCCQSKRPCQTHYEAEAVSDACKSFTHKQERVLPSHWRGIISNDENDR